MFFHSDVKDLAHFRSYYDRGKFYFTCHSSFYFLKKLFSYFNPPRGVTYHPVYSDLMNSNGYATALSHVRMGIYVDGKLQEVLEQTPSSQEVISKNPVKEEKSPKKQQTLGIDYLWKWIREEKVEIISSLKNKIKNKKSENQSQAYFFSRSKKYDSTVNKYKTKEELENEIISNVKEIEKLKKRIKNSMSFREAVFQARTPFKNKPLPLKLYWLSDVLIESQGIRGRLIEDFLEKHFIEYEVDSWNDLEHMIETQWERWIRLEPHQRKVAKRGYVWVEDVSLREDLKKILIKSIRLVHAMNELKR